MKSIVKRNGGFPSLFSYLFGKPFERSLFDLDGDFWPSRLGINVPTVNVVETEKEYKLELAAPGLKRDDFDVEIENGVLNISAEREESKDEKEGEYMRKEYSFNSFSRSFSLPENVNEGKIDARYTDGILVVTLPKLKASAPKAS